MSDINKVDRKPVSSPFPTVRRSTDPMQPESGEIEFSEELLKQDQDNLVFVQGTDKTEGTIIREEVRRKRLKKHVSAKPVKENQEKKSEKSEEKESVEKIVDIEV